MAPGIMCFGKKPQDPRSKKSEEIEKTLRADKKRQEREVKLLLLGMTGCNFRRIVVDDVTNQVGDLGAGESGKSTVLKQMRVIHAGGFTETERKQWRVVIFNNLINAFQIILGAMEEQRGQFEDVDNIVRALFLRQGQQQYLTLTTSTAPSTSPQIQTLDPISRCP